jgi:hypothetical protein
MAGRPVDGRLAAAFLLLASLVLVGCGGAALDLGGEAASASPLAPATSPPSATDPPGSDPPGTDPPGTDAPTDPPPGQLPTPEATPTSAAQTEPPDDPPVDVSMAGTWVGTIETNGSTQEIQFVLRDLRSRGGDISGTALWESGKVDNGLRGAFEGDTLTLDDSLVNGINVYEGTVNGDVFTGTWTTVPRLEGQSPGTFEVTREE